MRHITYPTIITNKLELPLEIARSPGQSICGFRLRRPGTLLYDGEHQNSAIEIKSAFVKLSHRPMQSAYRAPK